MGEYPPLGDAMRAVVFKDIRTYISRQKNTVAQYIDTCPILDLCLDTGNRLVSQTPKIWWK